MPSNACGRNAVVSCEPLSCTCECAAMAGSVPMPDAPVGAMVLLVQGMLGWDWESVVVIRSKVNLTVGWSPFTS